MSEAEETAVGAVDDGVDDVRQRARTHLRLKAHHLDQHVFHYLQDFST